MQFLGEIDRMEVEDPTEVLKKQVLPLSRFFLMCSALLRENPTEVLTLLGRSRGRPIDPRVGDPTLRVVGDLQDNSLVSRPICAASKFVEGRVSTKQNNCHVNRLRQHPNITANA